MVHLAAHSNHSLLSGAASIPGLVARAVELGRITKTNPTGSDVLEIQIKSNAGASYRIWQEMPEPLSSQDGKSLEPGSFVYEISSAGPVAVSSQAAAIFSSDESGSSANISIRYYIRDSTLLKAGHYAGSIQLRITSNSPLVPPETVTLPVRLEVESIFDLIVLTEAGSGINFGSFKPIQEKSQTSHISLQVKSNMNQPYQLSQILPRRLSLADGTAFPKDAFKFFGDKSSTGNMKVLTSQPVPDGESVFFISDNAGTPEKLVLNYILDVPNGSKAGSYSSEIKYSITTL